MGPTPLRPLQGIIGCCLRNLRNGERKGQEMGGEKAKNPAQNGVGTASSSTKNKDICYKQMSFYASNICVMVANAVSNCYKRRCSGSLRCSSLIML